MLLPDRLQGLIARLERGGGHLADWVHPDIEGSAAAHSIGESEICRLIREETYRTQECLPMVVGPLEGAFLKVMARGMRRLRIRPPSRKPLLNSYRRDFSTKKRGSTSPWPS